MSMPSIHPSTGFQPNDPPARQAALAPLLDTARQFHRQQQRQQQQQDDNEEDEEGGGNGGPTDIRRACKRMRRAVLEGVEEVVEVEKDRMDRSKNEDMHDVKVRTYIHVCVYAAVYGVVWWTCI